MRERRKAAGLIKREVWVHPDDWPKIKQHIERVTSKRKAL